MSHNTDFLYARPSAVEGVARLLDFGNCLNEYNRSATTEQADARALRADWHGIGDDMRAAIAGLAKELLEAGEPD